MRHAGRCHCGAIRFAFESDRPLAPRACQCGFCRKHGARTVTDPEGFAMIDLAPGTLRYSFGTGTTDFVICSRCGVYAGALAALDGQNYATLNLNAFDEPPPDLAAEPVRYDGESAEAKAERRRRNWTPALIIG